MQLGACPFRSGPAEDSGLHYRLHHICLCSTLTTAIEVGLKKVNCQFPATVLAMFVVFLSLLALGFKWKGLEAFYTRYLASAVSPAPWLAALDS